MKLLLTTALLASVSSSAFASKAKRDIATSVTMRGATAKKLVSQSRRLEENDEEEEEEENAFLLDYKAKFVMCAAGNKIRGEDEYEYSSVVYRLCPAEAENEKESQFGCTDEEKYGDYVVGINTYTRAYFEALERAQEENQNNNNNNNDEGRRKLEDGEENDFDRWAECEEAEFEDDDEGRKRKLNDELQLFIGPACTEDGLDIKFEMFTDEYCTAVSEEYTYYALAGKNLPYYEGGIASNKFTWCGGKNDDGEYEVNEYCEQIYENAGRCDPSSSNYCDTIEELEAELKAAEQPKRGWLIFFIILIVGFFVGGAVWWFMKRKAAKAAGEAGESSGPFNQLC